jgi:hypothetical protein
MALLPQFEIACDHAKRQRAKSQSPPLVTLAHPWGPNGNLRSSKTADGTQIDAQLRSSRHNIAGAVLALFVDGIRSLIHSFQFRERISNPTIVPASASS